MNRETDRRSLGRFAAFATKIALLCVGAASLCSAQSPLLQITPPTSGPTWDETIFQGAPNDGLVPETSELDNVPLNSNSVFLFPGVDHSHAIEGFLSLGFAGPGALDKDSDTGIPSKVLSC